MKNKYQSKILRAIHEDAKDMHEAGIISDARMREYDKECLVQAPKTIRKTASSESRSAGTVRNVRVSAKGSGS
jgi:DNA-binding transcriptional regulator YiaG